MCTESAKRRAKEGWFAMVSTYPSAKRLGSSSSLFSFAVTTSLHRGVLKVTVEGSNGSHEDMTIRAMSAMII